MQKSENTNVDKIVVEKHEIEVMIIFEQFYIKDKPMTRAVLDMARKVYRFITNKNLQFLVLPKVVFLLCVIVVHKFHSELHYITFNHWKSIHSPRMLQRLEIQFLELLWSQDDFSLYKICCPVDLENPVIQAIKPPSG